LTPERRNFGEGVNNDLRRLFLHRRQPRVAHEDVNLRNGSRKENRCLARGVAATNHCGLFAGAELRHHRGCGIMNALALAFVLIRDIELSVSRAVATTIAQALAVCPPPSISR
jgi:hypothetical protein